MDFMSASADRAKIVLIRVVLPFTAAVFVMGLFGWLVVVPREQDGPSVEMVSGSHASYAKGVMAMLYGAPDDAINVRWKVDPTLGVVDVLAQAGSNICKMTIAQGSREINPSLGWVARDVQCGLSRIEGECALQVNFDKCEAPLVLTP